MAFYQLEPFGDLIEDLRHGTSTALLANINRSSDARPEPYRADDFIFWRDTGQVNDVEPVLLDDPVAQGNLMRAAMFGHPPS